jgi:UDP-sugar transporter A1/2/3
VDAEEGTLSCDKIHLGVLLMLVMCCISSGAGVANEILLKHGDNGPLFWQNMQLYVSTCVFSLLNATLHAKVPMNGSFFKGYDWMTICVILSLALVGIIVSITLKYADNIVHSIASSLAMIFATVFSVTVMHEGFSMLAIPGYLAIVLGVSLYFGVFGSN